MIRLTRDRSVAIHKQFRGPDLIAKSLELVTDQRAIRQGTLEKHDFDSGVWKKAKDQLLVESVNKCSYCEAPTATVSYGDVEHYRPKSKYWWLAYCVDNYLASCALCNQKFKKDKFPRRNSKMTAPIVRSNSTDQHLANLSTQLVPDPLDAVAVGNFKNEHANEGPLLMNPYIDDPELFFAWRADMIVEEVELISRDNQPSRDFVDAANDIYGLNRQQLRSDRYATFRKYHVFRQILLDPGISAATDNLIRNEVANMTQSSSAFAGMVRFFDGSGEPDDWEQQGFLIRS